MELDPHRRPQCAGRAHADGDPSVRQRRLHPSLASRAVGPPLACGVRALERFSRSFSVALEFPDPRTRTAARPTDPWPRAVCSHMFFPPRRSTREYPRARFLP
ncbi:hypothetical protein PPTG_23994 [Phytophthora nicotianae INRA-310]|uniref:Uncharacterized protein n=1 Tax=Phytophthora nicotianae (strain INRA-310) TaxID=761204 RepID=W2PLR1_PHYN3|nr:hypothetical protein PPTG_23994 [Phytophthora nicotianae INRA-310]ETN01938.1 hypothetical protein PPTG_23994 [Phytophthora nicotianae INRA-310]